MASSVHCDIVSAEKRVFSGEITQLIARGSDGELGILPHHAPLLTSLSPGPVHVYKADGGEEFFYVSGGFLEIQPNMFTILADTAERAHDLDEAEAERARDAARQALQNQTSELEYSRAMSELAETTARLRTIERAKKGGAR